MGRIIIRIKGRITFRIMSRILGRTGSNHGSNNNSNQGSNRVESWVGQGRIMIQTRSNHESNRVDQSLALGSGVVKKPNQYSKLNWTLFGSLERYYHFLGEILFFKLSSNNIKILLREGFL